MLVSVALPMEQNNETFHCLLEILEQKAPLCCEEYKLAFNPDDLILKSLQGWCSP